MKITRVFLASIGALLCQPTAFAKTPLEAAQDLATSGEGDPNGLTLMIVSISLLFVFAISLIVAASLHVFKKKPQRESSQSARSRESSRV